MFKAGMYINGTRLIYQVDKSCFHRNHCRTYTFYRRTFFCGDKNLPSDKMSGRLKIVPDKTEF